MKQENKTVHTTVLKDEALKYLNIEEGKIYTDLTLGGGGHSLKILENLKKGVLIGFDLDVRALERIKVELTSLYPNVEALGKTEQVTHIKINSDLSVYLVNENFVNLQEVLTDLGVERVDGILADLGWSSDQLEEIEGLSYKNKEDELDMRFDKQSGVKAKDLLNALGRKELKLMFSRYSDIYGHQSNVLVDAILTARKARAIDTVKDLTTIIANAFPSLEREQKTFSFLSKVFQALRISVNSEYENLRNLLEVSFKVLRPDGNLVLITFHSGEENIVKEFIKNNRKNLKILSESSEGNYIRPEIEEINENKRARSAKLFALKKN